MLFIILAPLRDLLKNPVNGYSNYDCMNQKKFYKFTHLENGIYL
jgi:hypothetical protein